MLDRQTALTEGARILRFVIVGVTNTAIYTLLFLLFLTLGLQYVLASILGYAIAISIAYWLNHRFTFRAQDHSLRVAGQFVAVQACAALFNVVALAAVVESTGWRPIIAQLIIIPPVVATTFVINRRVVFRHSVDTRI